MYSKVFLKSVKLVWAAPVTLAGLVYASLFWALGWYKWHGVEDDALVWIVKPEKSPKWLMKKWERWGGHAVGNVVVLKRNVEGSLETLKHEQRHVEQVMCLGVFQPILYGLASLIILVGCKNCSGYRDNPFEIDARRHADQED